MTDDRNFDYPGGKPRDGRFTDPLAFVAEGEKFETIDEMAARWDAEAAAAAAKGAK